MALYDFVCPQGHAFEARVSMHADSITTNCPQCGMESSRVYSSQYGVIMRPWGYRMSQDDPNYFSSIPTDHAHYGWQDNRRSTR
jgi:putative FmdB family regulatory protein